MDGRVERTLFYIEQNIRNHSVLAELAEVACLSKHHFHRLFKAEVGQAPKEYVRQVRLKHIAHMLIMHRDLSVTGVAFDFGFSSPAAFTRSFKNLYGDSPRRFREKNWVLHKERLEKHWASLEEGATWSPQSIQVRHMNPKRLMAVRTKMEQQALNAAYRQLIIENKGRISHAVTIYVDSPFSPNREDFRLYIALDENVSAEACGAILELQGGYYSPLEVTGDFDALAETMFDSYQRDIEPSGYSAGSTIFYERLCLPNSPEEFDYFASSRTLYQCLKRRQGKTARNGK